LTTIHRTIAIMSAAAKPGNPTSAVRRSTVCCSRLVSWWCSARSRAVARAASAPISRPGVGLRLMRMWSFLDQLSSPIGRIVARTASASRSSAVFNRASQTQGFPARSANFRYHAARSHNSSESGICALPVLGANGGIDACQSWRKKHRKLLMRTQRPGRTIRDAPTLVCSSVLRERRISGRSPNRSFQRYLVIGTPIGQGILADRQRDRGRRLKTEEQFLPGRMGVCYRVELPPWRRVPSVTLARHLPGGAAPARRVLASHCRSAVSAI
jgi:hypothetical protein